MGASNKIALEPSVLDSLIRFEARCHPKPTLEGVDPSNPLVAETLRHADNYEESARNMRTNIAKIAHVLPELSASATINPLGGSIWFTVNNREDVRVLMQLAARWTKESSGSGIDYIGEKDGSYYRIQTIEGALPPTCRVVEEDVVIPAQPEKVVKKMVVKCSAADVPDTDPDAGNIMEDQDADRSPAANRGDDPANH